MSELGKMFLLGMATGGALAGAVSVAVLMDKICKAESLHDKYVKEWRRAQRVWRRHPRAERHKKHVAPLPMNLWGG